MTRLDIIRPDPSRLPDTLPPDGSGGAFYTPSSRPEYDRKELIRVTTGRRVTVTEIDRALAGEE